jgi:hypothetical protein
MFGTKGTALSHHRRPRRPWTLTCLHDAENDLWERIGRNRFVVLNGQPGKLDHVFNKMKGLFGSK